MGGLKSDVKKWAAVFWLGFLTYVVLGGTFGLLLTELGYIDAFCHDPPVSEPMVYENCKPCGLYGSIFGIIEIGNCTNSLLKALVTLLIFVPRLLIIVVAILLYGFVEPLADISKYLPVLFFTVVIFSLFRFVAYSTFHKNKDKLRFFHRILLLTLMSLGAQLALSF